MAAGTEPVEDRTAVVPRTERPAPRHELRAVRERQREAFGGVSWGAAFFGWLVAVGLGALLVGLLAAAGVAVGLTDLSGETIGTTESIGVGGAIALLIALAIAYACGGYVAGRMSRFDGARQGLAAWAIGVVATVVLTAAAAIFGSEYNVFEQLDLPALPAGGSELASGGALALAAVAIVTLLAAAAGGKAGESYHRRVDRAGFPGA
jgi:hypothetical protein